MEEKWRKKELCGPSGPNINLGLTQTLIFSVYVQRPAARTTHCRRLAESPTGPATSSSRRDGRGHGQGVKSGEAMKHWRLAFLRRRCWMGEDIVFDLV